MKRLAAVWNGRAGGVGRWGLLAVGLLLGGCDPGGTGGASGNARFPAVASETASPGSGAADREQAASGSSQALYALGSEGSGLLSVLHSELSPATLWHSRSDRVLLFQDMARIGVGAPSFLAYSSPTGIAMLQPGSMVSGDAMRESWLLAAFPGATGWTEWDSPWGLFLEHRPRHVLLGTNGVELLFDGPAGHWTMLPLYGAYRPPQEGREVLKGQGLKEKPHKTWEWPVVVARDPLTRLRYWAGVSLRFPLREGGRLAVNGREGTVTWEERFRWLERSDAWATRPVRLAPVSPVLGLALTKGQSFPVAFSQAPFGFEMPTVFGPWFAVPEADGYTMSFRVLRYVNETEQWTGASGGGDAGAQAGLREAGRALFGQAGGYRPEGTGGPASLEALEGYLWQARAVPYFDAETRTRALGELQRVMKEGVLVPGVLGGEVGGDEPARRVWSSLLAQAVWAVAAASGDRTWVRERWPLLRSEWSRRRVGSWAKFGRDGMGELGDGAAAALAWARLAWLAGDQDGYRLGCGAVAAELVHLHARLRGARWFREQQPWSPGAVLTESAWVRRLRVGAGGWEVVEGAGKGADAHASALAERWRYFRDPDIARFCREHLGGDVRREVEWLAGMAAESATARLALDTLAAVGFRPASGIGKAGQAGEGVPGLDMGRTAGLIRWLGQVRGEEKARVERLIPDVELTGPAEEGQRNGRLIGWIAGGADSPDGWPRMRWVDWPAPTGAIWDLGAVRVGDETGGARMKRTEGRHEDRWDVDIVGGAGR